MYLHSQGLAGAGLFRPRLFFAPLPPGEGARRAGEGSAEAGKVLGNRQH